MDSYFYYCADCNKLFKVGATGKKVKCSKCSKLLIDLGITADEYASLDAEAKEALKNKAKEAIIAEKDNKNYEQSSAENNSKKGEADNKDASVNDTEEKHEDNTEQNIDEKPAKKPRKKAVEDTELKNEEETDDSSERSSELDSEPSPLVVKTSDIGLPVNRRTVKVSLDYNPYLMEYNILFNGKEPRINSSIEKYINFPLQIWNDQVPHIMYDEMNGYDFDLEFTGTEMDFMDLEKAFSSKGISSEEVKCIYKKSLENRKEKLREIYELIGWLDNNRNARLDFDSFRIENQDIFDNDYPIIVIGEKCPGDFAFENANVSIEIISDANELNNTVLKNTPIIFDARKLADPAFRDLLANVIENDDVLDEQFFFYVPKLDNTEMYRRLIQDLGVKKPLIINDMSDPRLSKFFEYYPISDHIRGFLKTVRTKVNLLMDELNSEKEESDKTNGAIIEEIMEIENHIDTIKESISKLDDVIKTNISVNWDYENEDLMNKIIGWKSKKTKITNSDEAEKLSEQYEEEIKYHWEQYIDRLREITLENKNALLLECSEAYKRATGIEDEQTDAIVNEQDDGIAAYTGLSLELMKIKEEKYEVPKEGFLNSILKSGNSEPREAVLVVTYPCQKWREYVTGLAAPLMDEKTNERDSELENYCDSVAKGYIEKLESLLKQRIEDKEKLSEQLSEEIQILQKDSDWLNNLGDRLEMIERN